MSDTKDDGSCKCSLEDRQWTTAEMQAEFEVIKWAPGHAHSSASFVVVTRKSDGVQGTLIFTKGNSGVRKYFAWQEVKERQMIQEIHAFRRQTANEFASAQTTYFMNSNPDTLARYEQARAMLTYIPNVEYVMNGGKHARYRKTSKNHYTAS